ncbi:TPA: hypothetical protein I3798_003050 [Enterobacter cloacae]|uniref:hypothetical protein n=1 Tax=Enterobacterales TaxID=91347 RepID=UPI000BE134C8|nr:MULTISPECIES: hypothetical protein [Enterobacterales]MCU2724250.1 hypothetical protein [Enterobacter hormaechei subsp. xiangfangensis]HAV1785814.1 hypothetical protein [Enterobacter hormaechei subsp. steigerwaltii]EEQ2185702.1 hypothetical protein [Escherichia coli]EEU0312549.1 hypothetical protein [Escherichia coli]EKE7004725.1 hypothetical protein [Escherichia coli]
MLYHTLTDALIHTLAKEELSARSWPHLQLDYSLHHSLGDGVIFTGYLSAEDLHRIIPQLHAEGLLSKSRADELQKAVIRWGASIRLTHNGRWYPYTGEAVITASGFPDTASSHEQDLIAALDKQYRAVCQSVKVRGYKVTEATHPEHFEEELFCRRTQYIELNAVALDPAEFGYSDVEDEVLKEFLKLIFEQRARVLTLRFNVKCNGTIMAQCWTSGVVIRPDEPVRKWVPLDEINYLAGEARAEIRAQAQAFSSFLSAA